MEKDLTYSAYVAGSEELVHKLVEDFRGWAISISKSVARAWGLDFELDGLDGCAYEALHGCAMRFDPNFGVPFKSFARKRIHESCTKEAHNCKNWSYGSLATTEVEQEAREISFKLFNIFPELHDGALPVEATGCESELRSSIRHLLASATIISAFKNDISQNPEAGLEYKEMLGTLADLDPIHQNILWELYWQGQSMRALASEWGIDELVIVREHQSILEHISTRLENPKATASKRLKIRPKLRDLTDKVSNALELSPFAKFKAVEMTVYAIFTVGSSYLVSLTSYI